MMISSLVHQLFLIYFKERMSLNAKSYSLEENWNISSSTNSLTISKDSIPKYIIPKNVKDYTIYSSQDFSITSQNSYYINYGIEILMNVSFSFSLINPISSIQLPLPQGPARSNVVANTIVQWNENNETYSSNLAKTFLSDNLNNLVIQSNVINEPQRSYTIICSLTYHI